MQKNNKFSAIAQDDLTLKFTNIARVKQALLEHKGKVVNITITKAIKTRSLEQNSYYWGVVIKMIAEHCGYYSKEEFDDLHVELKKIILPTKGRFKIPASTSKMNTQEFNEFIEKVRILASQNLGLYIPEPNEVQ